MTGGTTSAGGTTAAGGQGGTGGAVSSTGGDTSASGGTATAEQPHLRGAFLQVPNTHDPAYWGKVVERMAELEMDTAIVQTESYLTSGGERNAVLDAHLLAVLDAAKANGLGVYLGLVLPEYGNGSLSHAEDAGFVNATIAASQDSITRVMKRFGTHEAFVGWYLPLELWTPDAAGLYELPRYVSEVSQSAKAAKPLPVLISPFISDLALTTEPTRALVEELAASVDIVALQDGVGARNLSASDLATKVTPFVEAARAGCESGGCELWVNAESFASGGGPAPIERFAAQLDAAHALGAFTVTYEFSNYWLDEDAEPGPLYVGFQAP